MAERVPIFGAKGNMLRTPRTAYAVNVDIAFDNRVNVSEQDMGDGKTEKVYTFIVDQRALEEQKSGHIYANYIVGYVIGKGKGGRHIYANYIVGYVIGKGKGGKAEVRGTVHVKEEEFVNDFDATFDTLQMEEIMEIIK